MGDVFYIIISNLIFLPVVIYRNFDYSHELLIPDNHSKIVYPSLTIKKIFLLRRWRTDTGKVRLLGFVFHIMVACFTFLLAFLVVFCSLVSIVKIVFDFHFTWFTTAILSLSGAAIFGYSGVAHILFGLLDWSVKRRGR